MKIGILYICTGKYTLFWDEFYRSSMSNFMTEDERHYFVFTDGDISTYDNPNVHVIYQERLGWPFDALMRYNMFLGIEEELVKMDYLFFFNANIVVKQKIGHEVLPAEDEEMTVTMHPGLYKETDPNKFPYDRNEKSNAYIPFGEGERYIQSGFNCARSEKYLKISRELNDLIKEDVDRNVIALWHDESYLNKYILDKKVKVLHGGYLYPEGRKYPHPQIQMTRSKRRLGGHEYMRGMTDKKKWTLGSLLNIFKKK